MKHLLRPGIHWLFAFLPVAIALDYAEAAAPLIFFSASLAIVPIARLISTSTEHLASYTGDAVGGLLNATFGNLPELIIAVVALKEGLHEMVLASLAGAILANLLLATGASFLVGGIKHHSQDYNAVSVRVYSSMMMMAVISLTIPSGFHTLASSRPEITQESTLNLYLAALLLAGYVLYLVFMIKTHKDFFRSESGDAGSGHHKENHWSVSRAILTLLAASVLAAYMSEILVGAAEMTGEALGMSTAFIGLIFLAVVGGAAESISAVSMAARNKMDLSMGIALGSSIQIALFIAPLLVIMSTLVGPGQLNLTFPRGIIVALFLSVILGAMISGDGRSNWYKGIQLILIYLILAMALYFIPSA